jgi:uncharacterized protein
MSPSTVAVGPSALGQGVFAARAFHPGQAILVLNGPILGRAEVMALGGEGAYAVQTGADEYVDLASPGRFLNHSCDPNAGLARDRVLIALRPIAPGEEIRFDYSTTMSCDRWTMSCRCEEALCRRVILAFQHLPPIIQNRYLQLGIVQRFIADEFRRRSPARRVMRLRQAIPQVSF